MSATPGTPTRGRRTLWIIVLAVAAVALFAVLVPTQAGGSHTPLPLAMLAGAGVCAAPLLAVPYPRTAIAVFCVAALALPLSVGADRDAAWPWPWSVPATIAFTLVVLVITIAHGWRLALVPWGLGNAGALAALVILPDAVTVGAATANLIVTASTTATALVIGVLAAGRIRVGEELSRSLEMTAAEQARRLLAEDRTRIARDLHDVVAHSMSVVQVQASTARYRIPDLPAEAATEFDAIAAAARGSLTEMRRLLGVLRTEDHTQELAPQQGISDIPDLVEGIRRAGVAVSLALAPPPGEIAPSVGVTAYRIVQEALSNAVRHAPGAAIDVSVTADARAITIRVHDDGAPDATASPSSGGHGVRGMQERAALLGGRACAGPDPAGGWTVTAVLPWTSDEQEPA